MNKAQLEFDRAGKELLAVFLEKNACKEQMFKAVLIGTGEQREALRAKMHTLLDQEIDLISSMTHLNKLIHESTS